VVCSTTAAVVNLFFKDFISMKDKEKTKKKLMEPYTDITAAQRHKGVYN
jgi:hypothetical protein